MVDPQCDEVILGSVHYLREGSWENLNSPAENYIPPSSADSYIPTPL